MRKNFVVILCLSILAFLAIVAILAPLIAPFAQNDMVHNPFDPPGAGGVLGADSVGRDMLSRMIYGLRYTMVIPLVATSIAAAIGVALAIVGALNKGWIDGVIGRCFDILMSIPGIIFALLVLAIVGVSLTTLVLTMAVLQSTTYYPHHPTGCRRPGRHGIRRNRTTARRGSCLETCFAKSCPT
jgi:peptide/nickel transport system permease protein